MSADGLLCAKQAPVNPLLDASHHRKYLQPATCHLKVGISCPTTRSR